MSSHIRKVADIIDLNHSLFLGHSQVNNLRMLRKDPRQSFLADLNSCIPVRLSG